jgi:CRP/FNR family transcriptional regulator, cyclic AMP receptor protein
MAMGPSVGDLRSIALFSRSSDAELVELCRLFVPMEQRAETQVLFDVGQPADAMYLLTAGEAELESPEDEVHKLHPPALLGELGALTGVPRSTKITVRDAVCYRVDALQWQQFLFEHHGVGLRVLRDVLRVAAEKIHRDQVRLGTMRQLSQWTQAELKDVHAVLSSLPQAPPLDGARGSLESLILRNRRQAMRVEPSSSMPVGFSIDERGPVSVLELSRTHLSFFTDGLAWSADETLAGTLNLAGNSLAVTGKVIRANESRVTVALDELSDEAAAPLDGYLTRAQLLDILL